MKRGEERVGMGEFCGQQEERMEINNAIWSFGSRTQPAVSLQFKPPPQSPLAVEEPLPISVD